MELNEFPQGSQQASLSYEEQQYWAWYYAAYQQQYYSYYNQNIIPPLPVPPVNKPPKLSANQKRKLKLREKKQELEQEKKEIGDWVRLECKELIRDVQKLEQQEEKRKQRKKDRLSHLIEIHKEIYKLRSKLGILKADSKKTRLVSIMQAHNIRVPRTKKPSRLKQLNQLFLERLKNSKKHTEAKTDLNKSFVTESSDEQQLEISQSTRTKAQIIVYPNPPKLALTVWNNIQLREWVNHMPSEELEYIVLKMVNKLAFQQAVKKVKQPLKFKKRVIAGFHEVARTLTTINEEKRSRCLILALNIKRNPFKEGTDDQALNLVALAQKQNIPVLNCSTRSKLGRAFTGKFGPRVSIISIVNYQGCEEQFGETIQLWKSLQIQTGTEYNQY